MGVDLVFLEDRRVWQHRNAAADSLNAIGNTLWLASLQRTCGGCSMRTTLRGQVKLCPGAAVSWCEPVKYICAWQHTI